MAEKHPRIGHQTRRSPSGRRPWQFSLWFLFVLTTICAALLSLYRLFWIFPLETLIMVGIIALALIGVFLYIGELFIIGWVVDFLAELGMPKFLAKTIPLEYEQAGEIIVVQLRDNVGTAGQCQSVEKQLKHLIAEHHCNFILDFSHAGNISRLFRGVMVRTMKAARGEAEKLGKPYFPLALPPGAVFQVFDDPQQAVAAMSEHGGQGWVVLCGVPVGVRAVSEMT